MVDRLFRELGACCATAFCLAAPGAFADDDLPQMTILGSREAARAIAGSVDLIDPEQLELTRPFTVNEALRKAPGVHVRDEEGFGLRPNIGIRGLNPTRSTKITLLEDGIPLVYAPYGDNASYFHPPIERYASIEVLKGANSLAYGPQTIGGIVNYVTPDAPQDFAGHVQLAGGSRDFGTAHARLGGGGLLVDFVHKQGDGARDNNDHRLDDANLKFSRQLNDAHSLMLRANLYREDSTVTYAGLTQAEFDQLGGRYNPFGNDGFDTERRGLSLSHRWAPSQALTLSTSAYYSDFDRDWWRQASSSQDAQCGAAFNARRLAGLAVDVEACGSVQGRLRAYDLHGIEPRLAWRNGAGELQAGAKWHVEEQDRRQVNGTSPRARTGTLVESNLRDTEARSVFIAQRFDLGPVELTPILRHERVDVERLNRLNGARGATGLSATMPGLGVVWKTSTGLVAFASVHEGFAPPRVEDLIAGSGTVTEVDAEESVNVEAGLRGEALPGVSFQLAWFRNDFSNLVAVGSIAGGATPLSQGRALFQGLELSSNLALPSDFFGQVALTWLANADQTTAFRNVASNAVVGVAGNRQPYAPEYTATVSFGYARDGLQAQVELQHLSSQYSDFANTVAPSADGQRGRIASQTLLGFTANYAFDDRWSTFLAVKNLTDRNYIVDRTRGILVGQPRLLQAGLRVNF
jgi:Fe(3+) dicitrate transport protein